MVRFYTVSSARTVIGSAFGGLIYITLPEGLKLADQTITVTGAIKAPVMTEGMTAKQWAAVLAASPAPWGEVVTSKLVISTPRSSLATVTDPADQVLECSDGQPCVDGRHQRQPPFSYAHPA
ncbi:hypothetical protein OEZ85_002547 [Tetradesmus obliquus]|uniref:Peptidase M60 domain-containing protein n=1 Tax=Tetradesmus obliquus TaxID=3088 RepID=A0ABY8TYN2_TETOB|nr:hypothetical protein OEZ85_002547 [Tetradesmus obliquus]